MAQVVVTLYKPYHDPCAQNLDMTSRVNIVSLTQISKVNQVHSVYKGHERLNRWYFTFTFFVLKLYQHDVLKVSNLLV